jgi:hypothetical protein
MKSLLKKLISKAVQNNHIWAILNAAFIKFAIHAWFERKLITKNKYNKQSLTIIESLSQDLSVLHGPFKGMLYPAFKSIGSAIAPKVLGSYERELHQVLEEICLKDYSEIVDVGCAEGYYAVGLAMRLPKAKVYAFDTNADAIHLCKQMAQLNHVAERLITGSFCDAKVLQSIPYTKRALIISDCEGYEKQLFTKETVPFLATHDLLIEVHDFLDIEISSVIRQRFEGTHSIKAIQSIDDITKAHTYAYDELKKYSLDVRRRFFAENRPHIMEWLYMTPLTA